MAEGMVICPDCKGTKKVQPKVRAQGCDGCDGCDCERCGATGKIVWIEEVFRKELKDNDV